jgi:hypothetical protein
MKLASCLLAIGVVTLLGCGQSASFPPISEWTKFDSPDAPYSILLPAKPTKQVQSSDGIDVTMYLSLVNKDLGVMTGSNAMPAEFDETDPEQCKLVLDGGMQEGISAMNGTVKEQKDLLIQGKYHCRECTATVSIPKAGNGLVRMRVFLLPGKLVQVMVIGSESQMQAPEVMKCLESIKVKI